MKHVCPCGRVDGIVDPRNPDGSCRVVGCQNCKHFDGTVYYTRDEIAYQGFLQWRKGKGRKRIIKMQVAKILQQVFCAYGIFMVLMFVIFATMEPTGDVPKIALLLGGAFGGLVSWKIDDWRAGK